ncbi:IS5 family transposase [Mesoterricola sediminis]|uniref:IS5 family transposase n=1 Tax=Mesoterricola sediminis TaxID=2927980 RepID=UPI00292E00FC|nr:IS5 family transposase [Mesoterricola sediminis]
MPRSSLTDAMWAKLEPLLPPERGGMGRSHHPNRPMVEAILWRHRTGAPWRDLPEEFGPWTSVYTRFEAWTKRGVWQRILEFLRKEADLEWVMPDGTILRAHQPSAGKRGGSGNQALGRSRGGCSTKIHLICDAHGNPLDFLVTPGQAHESRSAEGLLCGWQAEYVSGDRAYDGNPVRKAIEAMGATAVIPPHPRRKNPAAWDSHLYKARHAIEHGFAKLKQFRALATRFDKTARSFSAQVALACIVIWLRL